MEWPEGARPTVPELDAAYRRDLPVKIRIALSWDADETDIDLHVLEPDGEEAFYGHRRTSSGGFVSEDVTTGYGPEEYMRKEGLGTFKILSNYFASHQTALTGATTVTHRRNHRDGHGLHGLGHGRGEAQHHHAPPRQAEGQAPHRRGQGGVTCARSSVLRLRTCLTTIVSR